MRWSADSREILAGTGDSSLYVYDMTEHKARPLASRGFRNHRVLACNGNSCAALIRPHACAHQQASLKESAVCPPWD